MRRILLDTNAWLWSAGASSRLGKTARDLILDERNDANFSVVSAWEIIIKVRSGKLVVPGDADDYIRSRIRQIGVRVLPCTLRHVLAVHKLPLLHRDPFDRLLVAQATTEGLAVLSSDELLRAYDIEWIDARL